MDGLTRAALVRTLSALDDAQFTAIAAESRGVSGEAVAELARSAEYDALQKQSRKSEAGQALRAHVGGH
jgi:hypothetical protein